MERDWLYIQSCPGGERGRVLAVTPHQIAVHVTHHAINYGTALEEMQGGYILRLLKQTIFRATRDAICEHSRDPGERADG